MSNRRPPFLPVFLTLLAIAVAAALAYRVHSYRTAEAGAQRTVTARMDAPQPQQTAPSPPAETGTIVEVSPSSAPVLTREQRYRELLAMGSSPEAAAVQSEIESQQAKAAAQRKGPGAQSAALKPINPPGSTKPVVQPATVQHNSTTTTGDASTTTSKPEEPVDPDSDTVPPQLVSIEFNPPQVHDGEETMLIITAVDNLSGIRGISGTLTSPTGKALQGFAQQREGESNRYVSRVLIPKDAEEGTWKISFLNLSDNATNMTTLNYGQGTIPPNAVLRVISSRSDSAPPTLRSVSIARRAMRSGETNSLFVEAEDDKSGVKLVSAVFVSPSKLARLGFGCRRGDADTWECIITPPECLDCGEWQLEQIQMQDNANNYTTVRGENPLVGAVRLNITGGTCDNTPPVLQTLILDKPYLVIGQGDPVITVRVQVADDSCGVGGLSGQITGPGTNAGTFFAFAPEGGDGTWVGTFRFNTNSPRGVWRVQSITVNDKGQNLRIYYASDPVLARGQFVVR